MRAPEHLYRILLWAYPRHFRRSVGPELLAAFRRGLREAEVGRRWRFVVQQLWDLIRNVPAEWATRLLGSEFGRRGKATPRAATSQVLGDVKVALRGFRRRPAFTATTVAVLGLGIGATTLMFTVVHAVLVRPLPYADADRVVTVWQTLPQWDESPNPILRSMAYEFPISWPTYQDWLRLNHSFDALGIYISPSAIALAGGDTPELVVGSQVTSGVFAALGVPPLLGRTFVAADDGVGSPPLVVLSHGLWVSSYGADPSVLGKTMILDDVQREIVGVMPPSFYFPSPVTRLWQTVDDEQKTPRRDSQSFWGIARLESGTSTPQAQAEMEMVTQQLKEEIPEHGYGFRLMDRRQDVVGDVRPVLWLLGAAVATVLLVTCANVANLLLMRGSERGHELAVRAALGAGRFRILTQLLTESSLLALAGGATGLTLAIVGLEPLVASLPPNLPRANEIGVDRTMFLLSAMITLGTGVLFGAVPALRAARLRHCGAFSAIDSRTIGGRSRNRAQHLLVVAEVALSFALLVGAGVLARSMARLSTVELGFDPDNVMALRFDSLEWRYESEEQRALLFGELHEELLALPGVTDATVARWVPFVGHASGSGLFLVSQMEETRTNVQWNLVGASYFEAMRIPIVAGRSFGPQDYGGGEPRTIIVNEALARAYWPGEDPVGKRIGQTPEREQTVVGVARDTRHTGYASDLAAPPRSLAYLPEARGPVVALRVVGDRADVLTAARAAVHEVDPDLPFRLAVVDDEMREALAGPRFRTWVVGMLASLAGLLASVGVYGVLSYAVTQRTREIGIRMALGARARDVLEAVVARGLLLIGSGMVAGLAVVFIVGNVATASSTLLYEVSPVDPGSIVAVAMLLGAVGICASVIPALRATGVDPGNTLRRD